MRYILCLIILFTFITSASATTVNIVAIGDSITQQTTSPYGDWTTELKTLISSTYPSTTFNKYNMGVSSTATDYGTYYFSTDVTPLSPNIVIIFYGGVNENYYNTSGQGLNSNTNIASNTFTDASITNACYIEGANTIPGSCNYTGTSVDYSATGFTTRLQSLITSAQALSTNPLVVLIGSPISANCSDIIGGYTVSTGYCRNRAASVSYRNAVASLAVTNHIPYVDTWALMTADKTWENDYMVGNCTSYNVSGCNAGSSNTDGVHPNLYFKQNYLVPAIVSAIQPYLNSNGTVKKTSSIQTYITGAHITGSYYPGFLQ